MINCVIYMKILFGNYYETKFDSSFFLHYDACFPSKNITKCLEFFLPRTVKAMVTKVSDIFRCASHLQITNKKIILHCMRYRQCS